MTRLPLSAQAELAEERHCYTYALRVVGWKARRSPWALTADDQQSIVAFALCEAWGRYRRGTATRAHFLNFCAWNAYQRQVKTNRRLCRAAKVASLDARPALLRTLRDPRPWPCAQTEQTDLQQRAVSALAGLPPRERAAIRLTVLEEVPLREAGRRLGVSRTSVMLDVRRGLARLRAQLEDER